MNVTPQNTAEPRPVVHRACPFCDLDNQGVPALPCSPQEWPLKQCISCGMVYLEKTWALEVLYEQFAWDESAAAEDLRRSKERGIERFLSKVSRRRLALFPRHNAPRRIAKYAAAGNVLDVGSGGGGHLLQLPDHFVPFGIEISTAAVRAGRSVIEARGGELINKDALSGMQSFANDFFTGMIMRSFLEHDIRPRDILEEAHRILKKNGVLLIKVPNYASLNRRLMGRKWCGLRFPEHVNYFTPRTLKRFLLDTGFAIRRFSILDRLPTSDNMWVLARK